MSTISLPKGISAVLRRRSTPITVSPLLLELANTPAELAYAKLESRPSGLTAAEAKRRLAEHGRNIISTDGRKSIWTLLWHAFVNPVVLLLLALTFISLATSDFRSAMVMSLMIAMGVGIKLTQEAKADDAAVRLKAMITVSAAVMRDGEVRELPVSELVLGDILQLAAGDMVPADIRIVSAKDLFVAQGSLTGESFPVEKFAVDKGSPAKSPLELDNIAFLGSSVESGSAIALAVATGRETYIGSMAETLSEQPAATAFDRGVAKFTWLMIYFMGVLVPLVFLINWATKGNWHEAFFFALAVAVGLTPEMLPMIVTVCLSKGAVAMSRKKVIVKRINAIQNLGAMDVLCTDKTGTLTMDRVILERHCDVVLKEDDGVLALAYLNSHFQTGLKSILDRAVLDHTHMHAHARIPSTKKSMKSRSIFSVG